MNRKQKRAAQRQQRKGGAKRGVAGAADNATFSAAQQHHQAGRLDEAERLYDQILSARPNDPEVLHFRGVVSYQKGDAALGAAMVEKALKHKTPYPEALINLGLIYKALGRLDEAADCYRRVLTVNPDLPDAQNNLGTVLKDQGKLDAALDAFETATRLRPDYAQAWNNLGVVCNDLRRHEEAIRHLKQALEIAPDYADAAMNLGNVLTDTGEFSAGEVYLRQALSLAPRSASVLYNLGGTLAKLWHFPEAIEHLQRAIALDPSAIAAHINLAVTQQQSGAVDESFDHLLAALDIEPDNAIAWDNVGVGLRMLALNYSPDHPNVIERLELFQKRYPDSIESGLLSFVIDRLFDDHDAQKFVHTLAKMPVSLALPTGSPSTVTTASLFPHRVIGLFHYGRSGTGLLHSLIDGHPQVSTLPGILMKGYFAHGVWETLSAEGVSGLLPRFMQLFEVLFDATSARPVPSAVAVEDNTNIGVSEGLTNTGDAGNQPLSLDRERFARIAEGIMAGCDEVDQGTFFQVIHAAYEEVLGRPSGQRVLFYHIHNPGPYPLFNFLKHFPDAALLMSVREPLQNIESSILRLMQPPYDYVEIISRLSLILTGMSMPYFSVREGRAICMEHLKRTPEQTLARLCDWMGIDDSPTLYRQTVQGEKWWGDPSALDFQQGRDRDPFDTASIDHNLGRVLSDDDLSILGTLLLPFRQHAGYQSTDDDRLTMDLEALRPLLDKPLDFEKKIFKEMNYRGGDPTRHVSYRSFHQLLINRWNILSATGAYPHMIEML